MASSALQLRPGRPEDAEACGRICYEAFRGIAERHGYPPDFPAPEAAIEVVGFLLAHPRVYGVVAERDGRIVGSNFLDERSTIAGLGPITVDPSVQDGQVGRQLMLALLDRAEERSFPGVRLLQAAYHTRSLSLYAKLGFEIREPVVTLQGSALGVEVPGYAVRPATEDDLDACNRVCFRVHGHDRSGELLDGIHHGTARVVEHDGRITGYASALAFFGHAVGESTDDLRALIGAADAFDGPGILVPSRNGELFRWCLDRGLRVVHVMTLMSVGLYSEPAGAYMPSVLY
jgi:predicted N-acetyltransferase YhbS